MEKLKSLIIIHDSNDWKFKNEEVKKSIDYFLDWLPKEATAVGNALTGAFARKENFEKQVFKKFQYFPIENAEEIGNIEVAKKRVELYHATLEDNWYYRGIRWKHDELDKKYDQIYRKIKILTELKKKIAA